MKIGVRVMPRKEVLDTQGRAVEKTLQNHLKPVLSCRVGKYIVLDIDENTEGKALLKAKDIAEFVLHNPLIETYEIEPI